MTAVVAPVEVLVAELESQSLVSRIERLVMALILVFGLASPFIGALFSLIN